ncbi:MAG TPA: IclR family transcriptional regulator [Solirubrobacteraceae bacterium]|jgi:DNA-binding IclR family transcriptional regulator
MLGTVGKASRVLDLFTNDCPEWGVTEAAMALGVPRSSAHDLLDTLASTGFLRRVAGNRYRLGLKLLSLSNTALTSLPVRTAARPVMDALARRLGAAVHLATLEETEVLYVDKATPASGPRSELSGTGRRLPLHCTAVGKVLLAHQSPGTVATALEQLSMEPLTERSVRSLDALRFELAGARRAGVARDREGSVPGICCHAAPITEAGRVSAGISISVPVASEQRLGDRYDEIVAAAAARISRGLAATNPTGDRVAV